MGPLSMATETHFIGYSIKRFDVSISRVRVVIYSGLWCTDKQAGIFCMISFVKYESIVRHSSLNIY